MKVLDIYFTKEGRISAQEYRSFSGLLVVLASVIFFLSSRFNILNNDILFWTVGVIFFICNINLLKKRAHDLGIELQFYHFFSIIDMTNFSIKK